MKPCAERSRDERRRETVLVQFRFLSFHGPAVPAFPPFAPLIFGFCEEVNSRFWPPLVRTEFLSLATRVLTDTPLVREDLLLVQAGGSHRACPVCVAFLSQLPGYGPGGQEACSEVWGCS